MAVYLMKILLLIDLGVPKRRISDTQEEDFFAVVCRVATKWHINQRDWLTTDLGRCEMGSMPGRIGKDFT